MIEKLASVKNKSYRDFSSQDKLGKANIFFGTNGSGKSGLAEWVLDDNKLVSRIFNTNYVHENIELVDEISGVRLTVGKQLIDNKENVERIESASINIEISIAQLETEKELVKRELYGILTNQLSFAREQFSLNKKINQKQKAEADPVNALRLWEKEIDNSIDSLGMSSTSKIETQLEKNIMKQSKLVEIDVISEAELNDLSICLRKTVLEPSSKTSQKVSDWLKEGLYIHRLDNSCPRKTCQFCGNELNAEHLKIEIKQRINSEHAQLLEKLNRYNIQLIENLKQASTISHNRLYQDKEQFISIVKKVITLIEIKMEKTETEVSIEMFSYKDLERLNNETKKEKFEIDKNTMKLQGMLTTIENVAKSWIGSQLAENKRANEIPEEIEALNKFITESKEVHTENKDWIKNQNNKDSDLTPFSELVNSEFEKLGLDLKLQVSSLTDSYILKHSKSQNSFSAKNLSEGERRLLAFLHFYYDLFDRPHESFSKDIQYVIIDDPITSLDEDNRYYLTSIINNFIKKIVNSNLQLFIFTHSSMDYHNFGFSSRNSANVKFWKIYKNEVGNSEVKLMNSHDLKNYSDYYQSIFYTVMEFALKSKQDLDTTYYIHYGNQARLVFESHARSHYKIDNTTSAAIPSLKEAYDINPEKEADFKEMLDTINSLSHGFSINDYSVNRLSAKEVQKSVRIMLGVLYKKDPQHIEMLSGELITKNNKDNIKRWF